MAIQRHHTGATSLDFQHCQLTVSLTDVPTNDLNLWSHVDLSNFDGLQTFDGLPSPPSACSST